MSISPGISELLLIFTALLLLFGAKNLPKIARNLGKSMETFRRSAREVTDEVMYSDVEPEKEIEPSFLSETASEKEKSEDERIN